MTNPRRNDDESLSLRGTVGCWAAGVGGVGVGAVVTEIKAIPSSRRMENGQSPVISRFGGLHRSEVDYELSQV